MFFIHYIQYIVSATPPPHTHTHTHPTPPPTPNLDFKVIVLYFVIWLTNVSSSELPCLATGLVSSIFYTFLYTCLKNGMYYIMGSGISSSIRLSINFLVFWLTKSSYSLHPIKLKLGLYLDHDVEQRILFWGYSPP